MGTLNPMLSLTNQEVQLELNRIAEQSKAKLTVKPAEWRISASSGKWPTKQLASVLSQKFAI